MGFNILSKIKAKIKKDVAVVKKEVQKPTFLQGVQAATQITAGVLSITPIGKVIVKATVLIADKATHSDAASSYLGTNNNNSTLSMLPGGMLAQQVLGVVSPKLANQLESTLPDP